MGDALVRWSPELWGSMYRCTLGDTRCNDGGSCRRQESEKRRYIVTKRQGRESFIW